MLQPLLIDQNTLAEQAIENRNRQWYRNSLVPKWVDIKSVELDQFFTRPEIARTDSEFLRSPSHYWYDLDECASEDCLIPLPCSLPKTACSRLQATSFLM